MSQRSEQLSEVIKHELNNFLIREVESPKDTLITITKVELTPDLERAIVHISVLPIDKAGTALKFVKKNLGEAARYLNKHSVMRKVPKLSVSLDDYELKHRRIDRLME